MTHSSVSHDSLFHGGHDTFTSGTWLIHFHTSNLCRVNILCRYCFCSSSTIGGFFVNCVTGWRRLIGSLIFIGHFLQTSPIFSGSFVENDLQLRGSYESSPPCIPPLTIGGFFVNRQFVCIDEHSGFLFIVFFVKGGSMYMYIYLYIYIYMYIRIHTYIYRSVFTHVFVHPVLFLFLFFFLFSGYFERYGGYD